MIQITKIGVGAIGAILVVGFGLVGYSQYTTSQAVKNYEPVVITKTIVVTPTNEPTATPSASVTRIGKPASVTKVLTK